MLKYKSLLQITTLIIFILIGKIIMATPEEADLIGTKAKPWQVNDWIHSSPITLEDLRGKVILVRFWTGPACPFCRSSAPALNEFYQLYHDKGLEVLGFYHHKSKQSFTIQDIQSLSESMGFTFPIAIDYEWKTLKNWWLNKPNRNWTSVSFLIDQKGIIQHIHPGGSYIKDDEAYTTLKNKIEQLL